MFDISWGELILIGMVALVVIGPKELPTVIRTVGQWVTKVRRMASEFQGQFQEAMREAELDELKKQVETIQDPTKSFTNFNPLETARQEMEKAFEDKPAAPAAVDPAPADSIPPADAPPAPPAEAAAAPVEPVTSGATVASAEPLGVPASPATPPVTAAAEPTPTVTPDAATPPAVGGGRAA